MSEQFSPEGAFLEHIGWIDKISSLACAKHELWGVDAEDFAAWTKMRIIENDYAVLRRFRGESELKTYLASVVVRLLRDYVREHHGRWRPSATALRLGETAVELEQLVYREGYSLAQAGERLRTAERTSLSDMELARCTPSFRSERHCARSKYKLTPLRSGRLITPAPTLG